MFSTLYDLCLVLVGLVVAPFFLAKRWRKYRLTLSERLGLRLPQFERREGDVVIWLHAVSMGETKALSALFYKLKAAYPAARLCISTTTETGLNEAKRLMKEAEVHFLLPLDFSWNMRRLFRRIRPSLLILSEGDIWYHLLYFAKQSGARVALVNAKLSERSCHHFKRFRSFTRRLFQLIDLFCLQNEIHCARFASLEIPTHKLHVTGNMKLDVLPKCIEGKELQDFKVKLGLAPEAPVFVIGSTHAPEEELLLPMLQSLIARIPALKVLLVPRHPERFETVEALLQRNRIDYALFSQGGPCLAPLVLVDAMGVLTQCYQVATLAFVAGSYKEEVGGHNIFEPIPLGVPALFGPHMRSQLELKELVLAAGAGLEVPLEAFESTVYALLTDPQKRRDYSAACSRLALSVQGATDRTFALIQNLFAEKHSS
jgi:3-deoxy-D-manno-octulosonic-acid transferase